MQKGCELELVLNKSMEELKQWTYDSPSAVPSERLLSKAKFTTPGLPSRPLSMLPAAQGHPREMKPAPHSPRAGLCQTNAGTVCQSQGARARCAGQGPRTDEGRIWASSPSTKPGERASSQGTERLSRKGSRGPPSWEVQMCTQLRTWPSPEARLRPLAQQHC